VTAPAIQLVDRAAAVRSALRTLVARGGFHGASMAAVAGEAGVATGTAYVHYASKDELVLAAYLEVKRELGAAAVADIGAAARPDERFRRMWHGVYRHLAAEPDRARFLVQVDASPYARTAHARAMAAEDDPIMAEAARPDLAACLASLPVEVLYDLGIGPAVRLASAGEELAPGALDAVADACWRAITRAEARDGRRSRRTRARQPRRTRRRPPARRDSGPQRG
jgi:TetR/AcrR family transcriptional repressor of multidrug resistance operon